MKKVRSWPICLMTLLVAPAIMVSAAWAVPKDPPRIDAAVVTPDGGGSYVLDLTGENFLCDDADELEVWIGGIKVQVYGDKTDDTLEILDPAGITGPGTYLLNLQNDCGRLQFEVTVEAQADLSGRIYESSATHTFEALCSTGDVAVAGGATCPAGFAIHYSKPKLSSPGWVALCIDPDATTRVPLKIWSVCLRP